MKCAEKSLEPISNRRINREATQQYHISGNHATEVREGMLMVESKGHQLYNVFRKGRFFE